jgi:hypothetical protein
MSNWQKVQLNIDLLKWRTQVFIHNETVLLKQNEVMVIKKLIKKEIKFGEGNALIYK